MGAVRHVGGLAWRSRGRSGMCDHERYEKLKVGAKEHLQFTQVSKRRESKRETEIRRGLWSCFCEGEWWRHDGSCGSLHPCLDRGSTSDTCKRKDTWTPAKSSRKGLITKPVKPSSAHRATRRLVRQCYGSGHLYCAPQILQQGTAWHQRLCA